MRINFGNLTDAELCALIAAAVAEQQSRLPAEPRVVRKPAAETAPVLVIDEPPLNDKHFALHIKTILLSGVYVKSVERARFREIVEKYPAWRAQQGLPSDASGSAARSWQRMHVTYKAAEERR